MKKNIYDSETLAIYFHKVYEKLAPSYGYETRKETREFDPTSPNGKLMIAVCEEVLNYIFLNEDMFS